MKNITKLDTMRLEVALYQLSIAFELDLSKGVAFDFNAKVVKGKVSYICIKDHDLLNYLAESRFELFKEIVCKDDMTIEFIKDYSQSYLLTQWGNAIPVDDEYIENAKVCILDCDKAFITAEDPDDGCRSRGIQFWESKENDEWAFDLCAPFYPREVIIQDFEDAGIYDDWEFYSKGVDIIDTVTRTVLVHSGTDYTDQWYPYAIHEFNVKELNKLNKI